MTRFGYFTNTLGGKLVQPTPNITTNVVCYIGNAVDGPINTPVTITDMTTFTNLFGPAIYNLDYTDPNGSGTGKFNGNTLSKAVKIALDSGAQQVVVVRATGVSATPSSTFTSMLDVQPLYPGKIYNNVSFTLAVGTGATSGNLYVTINQPFSKGGNTTLTGMPLATTQIIDLINAVNNWKYNRTVKINPDTFPTVLSNFISTLTPGTCTFSGGDNETGEPGETLYLNKVLYMTRLTATDTGTFDRLIGANSRFHVVSLEGIAIDEEVVASDATQSIYTPFAIWLEKYSTQVQPVIGVASVRVTNLTDPVKIINYAKTNLLAQTSGYYNTPLKWINAGWILLNGAITSTKDLGGRLVVAGGVEMLWPHAEIGNYIGGIGSFLAAQIVQTPPERSVSYQPISSAIGYTMVVPKQYADLLASGVGNDQINDISGSGAYITCVKDPYGTNSVVLYDDPTTAHRNDYFRQLQNINLINCIHLDLYSILLPFINQPNSLHTQAAMKAAIKKVMDGYVLSGALVGGENQGWSMDITTQGLDADLGIVRVNGWVFPSNAIRAIVTTLQVDRNS